MLSALRDTLTESRVSLDWEIKPAEDRDEFFVVLTATREIAKPGSLLADWEGMPAKTMMTSRPPMAANACAWHEEEGRHQGRHHGR